MTNWYGRNPDRLKRPFSRPPHNFKIKKLSENDTFGIKRHTSGVKITRHYGLRYYGDTWLGSIVALRWRFKINYSL